MCNLFTWRTLVTVSVFTLVKEKASEANAGVGDGVRERSRSPTTQSSLPFCAGVHFSGDSIHPFNDRIKIRENRGLCAV